MVALVVERALRDKPAIITVAGCAWDRSRGGEAETVVASLGIGRRLNWTYPRATQ
jgi:hypothetical protein